MLLKDMEYIHNIEFYKTVLEYEELGLKWEKYTAELIQKSLRGHVAMMLLFSFLIAAGSSGLFVLLTKSGKITLFGVLGIFGTSFLCQYKANLKSIRSEKEELRKQKKQIKILEQELSENKRFISNINVVTNCVMNIK